MYGVYLLLYNQVLINVVSGALGVERKDNTKAQKRFLSSRVKDGTSLLETVKEVKPSIIIAVSGVRGLISEGLNLHRNKHCQSLPLSAHYHHHHLHHLPKANIIVVVDFL